MSPNNQSGVATLAYPEHLLNPEDFLKFIELDEFVDDWKSLGFDVEHDLMTLNVAIMLDPEAGDVIKGTGGLRKLRFASPKSNSGKRSEASVCYVYLKEHFTVLLVLAYPKNERVDLSADDKNGVAQYIANAKKHLADPNPKRNQS
jgi:hypothetical protein